MIVGERAKEHGIGDGKHRGIRGDSQGQDSDGGGRESRCSAEAAKSLTQIG
jgi:hypothetical protein